MESRNVVIVFLWIFVISFLFGFLLTEKMNGFIMLLLFFIALIFSIILAFEKSEKEMEEDELLEQIQNLEEKIEDLNKKIDDKDAE